MNSYVKSRSGSAWAKKIELKFWNSQRFFYQQTNICTCFGDLRPLDSKAHHCLTKYTYIFNICGYLFKFLHRTVHAHVQEHTLIKTCYICFNGYTSRQLNAISKVLINVCWTQSEVSIHANFLKRLEFYSRKLLEFSSTYRKEASASIHFLIWHKILWQLK